MISDLNFADQCNYSSKITITAYSSMCRIIGFCLIILNFLMWIVVQLDHTSSFGSCNGIFQRFPLGSLYIFINFCYGLFKGHIYICRIQCWGFYKKHILGFSKDTSFFYTPQCRSILNPSCGKKVWPKLNVFPN